MIPFVFSDEHAISALLLVDVFGNDGISKLLSATYVSMKAAKLLLTVGTSKRQEVFLVTKGHTAMSTGLAVFH